MQPLLKDRGLQADFDRDGFVVVPLLSSEQVQRLQALYDGRCRTQTVTGLYESSRHSSPELNRLVNQTLREEFTRAAANVFLPAHIYGGSFMVKSRNDSNFLPLHQDWSVVEEDLYSTMFIWCPLVDVSILNGCLFVLPASHRYFRCLRSGTYPSDRFFLPPELHRSTRDVPLTAGEAIVYSDALFHGSHANNGAADRVAVTARVTEPGAPLVYFHKLNERHAMVCEADEEFYLTHIDLLARGGLPAGARRLRRRRYRHARVTDAALQARIRADLPTAKATMAPQPLFRAPHLQAEFAQNGYAVIDLIDPEQIAELAGFYAGLRGAATPAGAFQVSLDDESPAFVRNVAEKLIHTVRSCVDRHLQKYRVFTASFVTKAPHPLGVVPPHQDWTFVDESRFCSATVWCPLTDVDIDNGALALIKGSHRLYDHVRPSPSPQYAPPFKPQLPSLMPYLNVVALRAGQAVVFDNRTLHASPPNLSAHTRVAFGVGVTQQEAQLRHYYLLPNQPAPVMEGYAVEPGFFYYYNNARLAALAAQGLKPEGLNSIGVFAAAARHYTTSELLELFLAAGNRADPVVAQRMMPPCAVAGASTASQADGTDEVPGTRLPLRKIYTPGNILREIRYRAGLG